jgi:hypothetical protein
MDEMFSVLPSSKLYKEDTARFVGGPTPRRTGRVTVGRISVEHSVASRTVVHEPSSTAGASFCCLEDRAFSGLGSIHVIVFPKLAEVSDQINAPMRKSELNKFTIVSLAPISVTCTTKKKLNSMV